MFFTQRNLERGTLRGARTRSRRAPVQFAALPLLLCLCAPGWSRAQTGGSYDLTWNTIDGGGATFLIGGGWVLGGTAGQPDAATSSGGAVTLRGGFWRGGAVATAVEEGPAPTVPDGLPRAFRLHPSSPNPFNPATTIAFDLPEPASVQLEIFNLRGERVRRLSADTFAAGRFQQRWDGTDDRGAPVASGTYVVHLVAGRFRDRHKIVLLK